MVHAKKILLISCMLLVAISAKAQFYIDGNDPGRVRWKSIETENYKLIFPKGMDSLARAYGLNLEKWRVPVGQSAGYLPGQFIKGKMPVVLHGYNALSNGSVAWAPKRLDLYLSPETYDPIPVPWVETLTIHEQRHAAQMQTGLTRSCRPFNWIVGEMFNGAASALYGGSAWMEGDAVVAETALTRSGRGRVDNFLNWYMVSFDNGDWRNWYSWKGGSQRNYVLNQYALGYVLISGLRYKYNAVNITSDRLRSFSECPWEWGCSRTTRRHTGKRVRYAFDLSAHAHYDVWKENADARGPYMPTVRLAKEMDPVNFCGTELNLPEPYTKYEELVVAGDDTYALQSGMTVVPGLVRISKDGEVTRLRPFNYYAGGLELSEDGKKLLWSETIQDPRWEQAGKSVIMSYDLNTGITKRVTRKGQLYHPYPYKGGLIASDYDYAGGQSICFIGQDGHKTTIAKAEDGLQIIETVAIGETIYASGLKEDGIGIYRVEGSSLKCVLDPQPVTMRSLFVHGDRIHFTSDRNGVEELYGFDPVSSQVCQISSTRYGGRDYRFSEDGKELIFSASTINGHIISKTAVAELPVKSVDYADIYRNPIADSLSIQEKRFNVQIPQKVDFSEEKSYRKAAHLFRLHSWAPIYFNYDKIQDFSFDNLPSAISLGVTGLFQNNLGTSILTTGYGASKSNDRWNHSGHIKWTYSGLYPTFEFSLDFNDRLAHMTSFKAITTDGTRGTISAESATRAGKPLVNFSVLSYVPLKFNSKGWYRGFVPQVRYTVSNDMYDTAPNWYLKLQTTDSEGNKKEILEFVRKGLGWQFPMQSLTVSARGYTMQSTPQAAVYPHLGIGAEAGFHTRLAPGGLQTTKGERPLFSPIAYAYLYGYLPGFVRQQGLRLTAKFACNLRDDSMFSSYMLNTLPRGMASNSNLAMRICGNSRETLLLTADYAIPVWSGDWNWGPFAYVRRYIITPNFDYMLYSQSGKDNFGRLYSVGMDFNIEFSTLCWIGAPFQVGLRVNYSNGDNFAKLTGSETARGHWNFEPLFSVSF